MSGFEPRITGVGSDRSANCAKTKAKLQGFVQNDFKILFGTFSHLSEPGKKKSRHKK